MIFSRYYLKVSLRRLKFRWWRYSMKFVNFSPFVQIHNAAAVICISRFQLIFRSQINNYWHEWHRVIRSSLHISRFPLQIIARKHEELKYLFIIIKLKSWKYYLCDWVSKLLVFIILDHYLYTLLQVISYFVFNLKKIRNKSTINEDISKIFTL